MNRDPQIVGWAHSVFGKREEPDTETLMASVVREALAHAQVEPADVDAIYVGVFNGGFSPQGFQGALVGMVDQRLAMTPATRVENACATGSAALYGAMDFVAAGRGSTVLVVGAEKMTETPTVRTGEILLGASYLREEAAHGSFAGAFGAVAREYFERYGDRHKELAMIAAKNHHNATANPWAHVRKDLGFEFCNEVSERNPLVAAPLRRTDCSMITDGAAALVLRSADLAASAPRAVRFRARQHVNDHLAMSRRDATEFAGARAAWNDALGQAGIEVDDLDLIEAHDCFTIAELIEYEALGLAERGEGHRVVLEGRARRDGPLPVNPSGGLKAKGHPIGATGVSQHVMASMQLTGVAAGMQVPGAELAGVFNMGGAAVANYASILERVR